MRTVAVTVTLCEGPAVRKYELILPETSLDRNRRLVVVSWGNFLFKWPCSPLLLLLSFTSCSPIQLGANSMTAVLYTFDDVGTTLDIDITHGFSGSY
jgi:hypothetical protein